MAYRVAIVDDSAKDAEFVQGILDSWAEQRQVNIQAEVFPSAEAFLFRYAEDKGWDILLLDIEMGAMDGVTMAKKVRQENDSVQMVFITGFADYISEGYIRRHRIRKLFLPILCLSPVVSLAVLRLRVT